MPACSGSLFIPCSVFQTETIADKYRIAKTAGHFSARASCEGGNETLLGSGAGAMTLQTPCPA